MHTKHLQVLIIGRKLPTYCAKANWRKSIQNLLLTRIYSLRTNFLRFSFLIKSSVKLVKIHQFVSYHRVSHVDKLLHIDNFFKTTENFIKRPKLRQFALNEQTLEIIAKSFRVNFSLRSIIQVTQMFLKNSMAYDLANKNYLKNICSKRFIYDIRTFLLPLNLLI